MSARSFVLALAAVLVLTGCSTTGTPGAEARPKSIAMTGVDPCAVFTPQQLQQFGMQTKPGKVSPAGSDNDNSASCIWGTPVDVLNIRQSESVYAQTVTFLGVDDAFARSTDPKSWTTIQGFRAVGIDKSDGPQDPSYQFYVDVDDKQSLNVAYIINGWKGAEQAGKDQARVKAEQAANIAVTNLLAR